MKSQLNGLKNDFDTRIKINIPLETALKREEVIKANAAVEIKTIGREEESKNLRLRREIAELKNLIDSKDLQLVYIKLTYRPNYPMIRSAFKINIVKYLAITINYMRKPNI